MQYVYLSAVPIFIVSFWILGYLLRWCFAIPNNKRETESRPTLYCWLSASVVLYLTLGLPMTLFAAVYLVFGDASGAWWWIPNYRDPSAGCCGPCVDSLAETFPWNLYFRIADYDAVHDVGEHQPHQQSYDSAPSAETNVLRMTLGGSARGAPFEEKPKQKFLRI